MFWEECGNGGDIFHLQ